MLTWIADNREWIFSGIGVAALSGLGAWIFSVRRQSRTESEAINQNQRGGSQSTNVQIGKVERRD